MDQNGPKWCILVHLGPPTVLWPFLKTQEKQAFKGGDELFDPKPFAWKGPAPPGGLRPQKLIFVLFFLAWSYQALISSALSKNFKLFLFLGGLGWGEVGPEHPTAPNFPCVSLSVDFIVSFLDFLGRLCAQKQNHSGFGGICSSGRALSLSISLSVLRTDTQTPGR